MSKTIYFENNKSQKVRMWSNNCSREPCLERERESEGMNLINENERVR